MEKLELPMANKIKLKEASKIKSGLTSGHRMCRGCGAAIIGRQATIAAQMLERPTVLVNATGCLEVASTIYPYNAWKLPWIHNAFENAAATASGAEAAFNVLKKKGQIEEKPHIIVFGGDGGTFDIGLQSLSGAVERGHDFLYICYNNGGYMNTGIQRSSATPIGASTTTSPGGKVIPGKPQFQKDLLQIMWAHDIPVFTASPAYPQDLIQKVQQGLEFNGPAFMLIDSVCTLGWKVDESSTIKLSKLAIDTGLFPILSAYKDKWELSAPSRKIALRPDLKRPIEDYLIDQGRFKHLFKPEKNEEMISTIQGKVDEKWERIKAKTGNI
ncbi:MAG: Pyruvate synthase subunit PorB [Candidatus Heimdallarchaeota archaeon LC_2]|nr:MAG: Pyruvate synthase subunit PorB [Candidatus Heimdallarchaeota archaeon LC_2]